MNQIIKDLSEIKPHGAPREPSDFLRQDEIRIRSVEDIKKLIKCMPESDDGTEWIKVRVPLSKRFQKLNDLPEAYGLFVYVRKDIRRVIANLFGNLCFAGLIGLKYSKEIDESTTMKNLAGEDVHPQVFSEMWTGIWWRDAEVCNLRIGFLWLRARMAMIDFDPRPCVSQTFRHNYHCGAPSLPFSWHRTRLN
jgi:hypothetical protein